MTKVAWIGEYLEAHHVNHRVTPHQVAFRSQDIAAQQHVKGRRVAKVVVAMAESGPLMLVLPASRYVDFSEATNQLQQRPLRLATENEIAKHFPEVQVGAVPPLKHWGDMPLYLDDQGFAKDQIMFSAGVHDESIVLKYYDWVHLVHPKLAKFAVKSRPLDQAPLRSMILSWLAIALVSALAALAMSLDG